VEARVEAVLKAVDSNSTERVRPYNAQKVIWYLRLRKICRIDSIPNECPCNFQEDI
jgi:hypothetical protein